MADAYTSLAERKLTKKFNQRKPTWKKIYKKKKKKTCEEGEGWKEVVKLKIGSRVILAVKTKNKSINFLNFMIRS